jgi:two-component system OmpR family sensor kinase
MPYDSGPHADVLYVEDDQDVAQMTIEVLSEFHTVVHASDVATARARALQQRFDVMVIDRRLPGGDGIDLVRAIRTARITTPILLLTALGAVDDRVEGLDAGANDYLVKPFDYGELLARIRALVRGSRGLGILGVIVLSLIAWFAARRAVRPLGEALRLQRNFVADASHELRTPLTTLTSRIQIAQRRLERGGDVAEALDQLRSDADAMNDMLTDLLMAAEGKAETTALAPVGEAMDAAVSRLQPLADDSGVTLEVISTDRAVRMPLPTLTRILMAVVDNAIQHSPRGGVVTIAAATARNDVEIRVSDQGSGIDPADAERIFERFARGSETGRRRGFGLGLALVRDVLTRYAGRIEVESTSSGGTTFVIALPSPRM